MNELRVYIILRNGEPLAAFASPATAGLYLMQEPSGLKLKSVLVRDMQSVPVKHLEDSKEA